jgi:dihydroorotase
MNDATTYGSVGERPAPSIFIVHFSIEWLFNMITSTGSMTILKSMWSNKALRAFEYYPAGSTTDNDKYYGNAYLPILEVTSQVGNLITIHTEFHCDNGITIGAAS